MQRQLGRVASAQLLDLLVGAAPLRRPGMADGPHRQRRLTQRSACRLRFRAGAERRHVLEDGERKARVRRPATRQAPDEILSQPHHRRQPACGGQFDLRHDPGSRRAARCRGELGDRGAKLGGDLRRLLLEARDLGVVLGRTEVVALAGEPVAQLPEMDPNAVGRARGAGPMGRMILLDLGDVRHHERVRREVAGSDGVHEKVLSEGTRGCASKRALHQKALETNILWVRNCSRP
ncbi:MAG: hypothetical protein QOK16_4755 [Solirubrobacteraceae bacterium]|nr:hypothetical protein [Solirubrobacteraceae bacterium]